MIIEVDVIKLSKVCITFNNGTPNANEVLKNINLCIEDGEFVTILGPNGAGKTSLTNILSGNLRITSGAIFINDIDVTNMPVYERSKFITRVFQNPLQGIFSTLTIAENLSIALSRIKTKSLCWAINKEKLSSFVNAISALNIGLEDRLNDSPALLSGGQRQALSLIMATLLPTKVLLLDEHTAALDPKMVKRILKITKDIVRKSNITTIMITHSVQHAIDLGTRIIVLKDKKIVHDIKNNDDCCVSVEQLNSYLM